LSEAARSARDRFLSRYLADLESRTLRTLAEYQSLFPGFEEEVADEFRMLEDEGESVAPVSAPDPTGDMLGPYRIVRELGRGGQAVVYLATDERLGREVALKVLRAGAFHLASGDDMHRFRREAEVSARLEHPGICSVYEAAEAGGLPYIAMRHVRGETLAWRIAKSREAGMLSATLDLGLRGKAAESARISRRSDIDAVLGVFESCARALHFAHELGLVHRDVKPGNIMLADSGEPVLLDFGLARVEAAEHSLTASGVVMGTPYYMAPEQVRGEAGKVDRRTDVYALGVSLYETLTLQRPFEAPSREALYRQILLQDPRPPRLLNPRIGRDLQVVLQTAMAKERARRYESALDMAEDLRRVRSREPIVARPAGALLRLWRWSQRRPAVASLSGVLLVTVVISGALLLHSNALLTDKVAEFTRLSDLQRITKLSNQSHVLRASMPADLNDWVRWRDEVEELRGRAALHRATANRLEASNNPEETWQLNLVKQFLVLLDRLEKEDLAVGLRCLEHVRNVEQRSIVDAHAKWERAIKAVSDQAECPAYGGLKIVPQMGLVPLGPDPASGLWEFAHLASGAVPERGPSGVLRRDDSTGIVLVLLPGGPTVMGARKPDADHPKGSPHVDSFALQNESPLLEIELPPFFLSKYEVTQGQWWLLTGQNRSRLGRDARDNSRGEHPLWPVEHVDHAMARKTVVRFGLSLPSEAQWEYAARGGTATVWWHGDDPSVLDRYDNILDSRHLAILKDVREGLPEAQLDDGFALLAPVGSFPANPFGLHDVHGNVAELTLDEFLDRDDDHRIVPETGQLARSSGKDSLLRVVKGGSLVSRFYECRCAFRSSLPVSAPANTVGLRPSRAVDR